MNCGIYKITNTITNKCYIGSSIDINIRWNQHRNALKSNKHHSKKLQRSYNIHGEENFNYEIIEECDKDNLLIREQYYIDLLDGYKNGYNSVPKAENNFGMRHTDETKEILREKSKGNKNRLGMTFTDESKRKISDTLKGRPLSEETKKKMSESRKGMVMSEEARNKLVENNKARRGTKMSDEVKKKMSIAKLGKKQKPEVVANRVKKNTGQKRTDEVKKKMSEAMKGIKKGPLSEEQKIKRANRFCSKK